MNQGLGPFYQNEARGANPDWSNEYSLADDLYFYDLYKPMHLEPYEEAYHLIGLPTYGLVVTLAIACDVNDSLFHSVTQFPNAFGVPHLVYD